MLHTFYRATGFINATAEFVARPTGKGLPWKAREMGACEAQITTEEEC